MFSRSIVKMFLFATILLTTVAIASAATPTDQTSDNSVGAIHTYMTPDLTLKRAFVLASSLQPPGASFQKTCRCSCGTAKCANDSDCGGGLGSCSHFISCCAKPAGGLELQGGETSSRKTPLPAFKQQCN
ncbi:MAG TPA: hypothetical protein VIB39_08220 [Candidatus Angelobacter sp.]|jgi:hypothetical protein